MNLMNINILTDGPILNVITSLQRQNLIVNPLRRVSYNRGMELAERNPDHLDGYEWQELTVPTQSFFFNCRLYISDILLLS